MANHIDGNIAYTRGSNEIEGSSAERKSELYNEYKNIEESIKNNVYTGLENTGEYRLKSSKINFLATNTKILGNNQAEYGNDEFDHMNKTLNIIKFNNKGAGDKYSDITGGSYEEDSVGEIFTKLLNFMKSKGLDRPKDRVGEYTNADFLYMVALGQALVIKNMNDKRSDKSASKVSDLFGDNILGALSMTDFQNTDFYEYTKLDDIAYETESGLNDLQNEIVSQHMESNENNIIENGGITNVVSEDGIINAQDGTINAQDGTINAQDLIIDAQDNEAETNNNEAETNVSIEKIGDWEFPKTKDVYSEGEDNYLFTLEDTRSRGIDDISFVPIIYNLLEMDSNGKNIEEANDLKNLLIRPWFEQMGKVIEDMRKGIIVDGKKYNFTDEQIKQAIENKGFIKTIEKDGKEYELIFSTRTPEMIAIKDSVRPIGNTEYNKSGGQSGGIKNKYEIKPIGLIYKGVKGLFKKTETLGEVVFGDRVLKG